MPKKTGTKKDLAGKHVPADVKHYIDVIRAQANEDMKHHIGALMEHVDDRIAGIGERFVDFDRKLDSNTEMIGALAEDVSILRLDVSVLKEDVSVLKEDVSVLKEDVSVLKEDVAVLKEDVSVLKKDVSVLKTDMGIVKKDISTIKGDLKQKVDREEFVSLAYRVTSVERKAQ